jgi:hypothetical protein
MGGIAQAGKPPEPEDTVGPAPSITADEFRARFTEEMREALWSGMNAMRLQWVLHHKFQGHIQEDAEHLARQYVQPAMEALQLIGFLAPPPFQTLYRTRS